MTVMNSYQVKKDSVVCRDIKGTVHQNQNSVIIYSLLCQNIPKFPIEHKKTPIKVIHTNGGLINLLKSYNLKSHSH